jgi:hypothetical protein
MAIMQGLATYEIYKTGFTIFIMILCFCCAIGVTIYNFNQNYLSTSKCNIVLGSGQSEILTYDVNDKTYVQTIPPSVTTNKNVTTVTPAYKTGACTLYYKSADPNAYSVNYNPTTVSGIVAAILCCLAILTAGWFLVLRANPELAGVMGGINAATSVISSVRGD